MLETAGIEVYLVNAHHAKNVPGRKTDVSDCQWLQYLHSVGLLRGSFRPPDEICAARTLIRHRGTLVVQAAAHVQHMQKALVQMNVRLQHVLSDLSGTSGLAITVRKKKIPIAPMTARNAIQRAITSSGVAAVSDTEGITNWGAGPGFGPRAKVNAPRTGCPSTEITRQ